MGHASAPADVEGAGLLDVSLETYLLRDLFEKNTFWEFETQRATAQQTEAGAWQVTLDVRGRKIVVDEAGVETEAPMDDWIEVGVFDEGEPYLQKHRIGSGKQTITVTAPQKPARAGIDPRHLLSDLEETDKNIKAVKINPLPARSDGTR